MTWATLAYLLGGSVLSAAGGAVVLAALLGDWFGGGVKRRRCPKCWFDLSGTPGLTCPECGKAAKRESRLFTTRRRWWLAVLGLVIVLGGSAMAGWSSWRKTDWFSLLPLAARVEFWDLAPDPEGAFEQVMKDEGSFSQRRKRRVMDKAMRWLVDAPTRAAATPRSQTRSSLARAQLQAMSTGGVMWGNGPKVPVSMLSSGYSGWPLSDEGKDDLLKLVSMPQLGVQRTAIYQVVRRVDLDERFTKALCDAAMGGAAQQEALEILRDFVVRGQSWARETLATVLNEETSATALYTAACSLLWAIEDHPAELVALFASTTDDGRIAIMAAVLDRRDQLDTHALYPSILEQALGDQSRASKAAYSVLTTAPASADEVIVDGLLTLRGTPLLRLLDLVKARRGVGGDGAVAVAAELERIAGDASHEEIVRTAAREEAGRIKQPPAEERRGRGKGGR